MCWTAQAPLRGLTAPRHCQAALADPDGFAAFGETPRAFDEVQRAGDPLIRAIKSAVDDDASRGQFLLNGSADFLTVPTISESLAGAGCVLGAVAVHSRRDAPCARRVHRGGFLRP